VPLHVIEELWEALQSEEEEILDSGGDAEESDIVMAVGSQAPREQVKRTRSFLNKIFFMRRRE